MIQRARPDRVETERLRGFIRQTLSRHAAGCDEARIDDIMTDLRMLRVNSELIREGKVLHEPMFLVDGWGVRQRMLSDGRRQIFSFVLPGDAFGLCARPGSTAIYNTFALTPVIVAPAPFLATCLHEEGAMTDFAWNMLSIEESSMASQVMRMGRQSAYERLINLLLEFYYRLDAVGLASDNSFVLPFTQEVLSDALGLSVVHTNRTLQQLRRERLIETQGTIVHLFDLRFLTEIADFRVPPILTANRQV